MARFLSENIGTIAVGAALLCAVAAIVAKLISDRRSGRAGCGCDCGECGGCGKTPRKPRKSE